MSKTKRKNLIYALPLNDEARSRNELGLIVQRHWSRLKDHHPDDYYKFIDDIMLWKSGNFDG